MVTGFIEGKRARGHQRETYLTYLQKMKGMSGYSCPNSSIRQYDIAYNDDDYVTATS